MSSSAHPPSEPARAARGPTGTPAGKPLLTSTCVSSGWLPLRLATLSFGQVHAFSHLSEVTQLRTLSQDRGSQCPQPEHKHAAPMLKPWACLPPAASDTSLCLSNDSQPTLRQKGEGRSWRGTLSQKLQWKDKGKWVQIERENVG